jgi:hypothetical protein
MGMIVEIIRFSEARIAMAAVITRSLNMSLKNCMTKIWAGTPVVFEIPGPMEAKGFSRMLRNIGCEVTVR